MGGYIVPGERGVRSSGGMWSRGYVVQGVCSSGGGTGFQEGVVWSGGRQSAQGAGFARGVVVPCDLSHHAFDVTCMLPPHQLRLTSSAAAYIVLVGHVTCKACWDIPPHEQNS